MVGVFVYLEISPLFEEIKNSIISEGSPFYVNNLLKHDYISDIIDRNQGKNFLSKVNVLTH